MTPDEIIHIADTTSKKYKEIVLRIIRENCEEKAVLQSTKKNTDIFHNFLKLGFNLSSQLIRAIPVIVLSLYLLINDSHKIIFPLIYYIKQIKFFPDVQSSIA